MRAGWDPSGSIPTVVTRPFPAGLAVYLLAVPRPFRVEGHPPSSFSSPSASVLPPARCALPSFSLSTSTRVASERLPWGFLPLRDLDRLQRWHGFPFLMPRSFPVYPGWDLPSRDLRPRRFARPRRLLPQPTLRAYFISLPRPGFLLQGFVPRYESVPGFSGRLPSCRSASKPAISRSSSTALAFRGFLLASSAVTRVTVRSRAFRAPLGLFSLRVPLPAPRYSPSRNLRLRSLPR